ncbi:hypothetical protein LCGC14_0874550 [marine sediment metagenome]|uniref:Uncharacterized protein n=1 Tax=marine sediment metagenome TaxID=412755 RepID=A0A0F9SAQ9_9ZZZZ|nr:MAG: hypothetical protein Lokiarch_42630 [Candidatus Lokiarchaeum sp. GC14_75]
MKKKFLGENKLPQGVRPKLKKSPDLIDLINLMIVPICFGIFSILPNIRSM